MDKEYLENKKYIEDKSKSLIEEGTLIRRNLDNFLGEWINGVDVIDARKEMGDLLLHIEQWDMDNDKSVEADKLGELILEIKAWLEDKVGKELEEPPIQVV